MESIEREVLLTMRNCKQTKCSFLGTNLCPICPECSAKPSMVDEDCVLCWNCEMDEGFIRGKPNLNLSEENLIQIKN